MDSSIFLYILFFFSRFLSIESSEEANCRTIRCHHSAPDIHFPFQESRQNELHCGCPGFQLSCKENTTMIHFPNYGDLVVKSINYSIKKLDLLDPRNCVHQVFLDLNLSLTPFQYYYVVNNYTYLNCSAQISSSFLEIPCLSGSSYHVYAIEPSSLPVVPVSCELVRTVAIPFSFSPYLADNSFGLGLTWNLPEKEDSEIEGFSIKKLMIGDVSVKFWKVLLCILAVAVLASTKICHQSKKLYVQIENGNLHEVLNCCKIQDTIESTRSVLPMEDKEIIV